MLVFLFDESVQLLQHVQCVIPHALEHIMRIIGSSCEILAPTE